MLSGLKLLGLILAACTIKLKSPALTSQALLLLFNLTKNQLFPNKMLLFVTTLYGCYVLCFCCVMRLCLQQNNMIIVNCLFSSSTL